MLKALRIARARRAFHRAVNEYNCYISNRWQSGRYSGEVCFALFEAKRRAELELCKVIRS